MAVRYKVNKKIFDISTNTKCRNFGNSLVVQWLGLHAFTAKGPGSISGQGTKIPQASRRGQNQKNNTKQKNKISSLKNYKMVLYEGTKGMKRGYSK